MKITDEKELEKKANEIRIDIIEMCYKAQSGHPGGSLSCADILTLACLLVRLNLSTFTRTLGNTGLLKTE